MAALPTLDEIAVMDGRELDAALLAAEKARREVEATIAAITARCDETVHYREDGHWSVKQWSMAVTNCSSAEAHRRRGVARTLQLMPDVRDAFHAATVGVAQVRELADLYRNPRAREQKISPFRRTSSSRRRARSASSATRVSSSSGPLQPMWVVAFAKPWPSQIAKHAASGVAVCRRATSATDACSAR